MKRIYQRLIVSASPFVTVKEFFSVFTIFFFLCTSACFCQELISSTHNPGTYKNSNNTKVLLIWNPALIRNSSHFTIEKSLNGKIFSDAGIVFTMEDPEIPRQWSFLDELKKGETGLIYYRLKLVDLEGKCQHSPLRVIRIGNEKTNPSVLVYQDSGANELRITLPAPWHDRKVVIDIYTPDGVLARKFVRDKASATETININELTPGGYMIRLSKDKETVSRYMIIMN